MKSGSSPIRNDSAGAYKILISDGLRRSEIVRDRLRLSEIA